MFDQNSFQQIKIFFLTKDPIIYQLLDKIGYLQPTPPRNLFSLLIGSIIGQKIRFTLARKLRGKLYTQLGTDNFYPEDILSLGISGLKQIGLDNLKQQIILNIAQYILKNPITTHNLAELKKLPGIGNWTINCTLLMYSLNESENDFLDYLLMEDLIIRRGIKDLYQITDKHDPKLKEIQDNWKPYRGIVTWYLWKEYS